MRIAEIWGTGQRGVELAQRSPEPVWFSSAGIATPGSPESAPSNGIVLIATRPGSGVCGLVMVPDGQSDARLNGVRLTAGAHTADHGDMVTVGPSRAWFAVAVEPDHLPYDPDVTGTPSTVSGPRHGSRPETRWSSVRGLPRPTVE